MLVVKRSGVREPFDRAKVLAGLASATKSRPVEQSTLDDLVSAVEDALRLQGTEAPSSEVGRAVLERLRDVDVVAAVRFASVYKEFAGLDDFERELTELTRSDLIKATEPKRHPGS